jgi:hypothetical protein
LKVEDRNRAIALLEEEIDTVKQDAVKSCKKVRRPFDLNTAK